MRFGQASDAMFRYLNTGTSWERWAFATTIARRASAAENLAQGEEARGLLDSFVTAFEASGDFPPGHDGEGKGGKALDRALAGAISLFQRAKSYYFAQPKKNARTKSQEGLDYFPTPEPLGLKMVEWAGQPANARYLEPSAGHGAIARWFPELASRTAVEPSPELGSRLALAFDGRIVRDTFENLDTGANKFDAIVMNPPFGHGGKTAIEHLAKAWKHLVPNGRVVAIIPRGPSMDKRLEKFYEEEKGVHLVAEFALPTSAFERAGTSVSASVIVLQKRGAATTDESTLPYPKQRDWRDIESIGEFFDRIENMELDAVQRPSDPASAPSRPDSAAPPRADAPSTSVRDVKTWEQEHGQTGATQYMATPAERVDDVLYRKLADLAKKHNGYYSRYKNAVQRVKPGFVFKTALERQAWIDDARQAMGERPAMNRAAPEASASARRGMAVGGMPIKRLTKIVDGIRAKWANAPDIEVVSSAADLPDRVRAEIGRQEAGGAEAAPQGVYWNGTVYLVADQLPTEGAVVETLLHETLGHYGLRGVFGARLNPFLDRLALARPAQMREKARDYGLSLANVEERRAVAEELLAEMAQTSPELDIVQRAIAAVRAFLRDVMGLPIAWSDADIIAKAILPARRFVEQGPGPGDGAMPDGVAAARGPRLSTLLRRYGQQPASPQEAARWLSDGWRVFVAHEMDEAPIEVTSVERLLDYTYADDQMIGLPPGAGGNGPMFQRAFHGSPHRFDRFSNDFNGEGEGHAAFGYGHYFASRREIAEWYRDTLSRVHTGTFVKDGRRIDEAGALAEYFRPGRVIQGWGGADRVIRFNAPKYDGGAWSVRVVRVQRDGSPMRMAEERVHATRPDPRDIKEFLRADGWTAEKPGAIYTVDIPEDSEMLLWDRPVSEQPQLVQDAFRDYIDQRIADMPYLMRNATPAEIEAEKKAMLRQDGEDLYNALSTHQDGGDRGASAYLRERGVRGIKYLDGASRFGGTGSTFNYVVFDDSDIRVTDIRFKRPGRRTWDTPEPSKMDDFLYTLQDRQIDMRRVVQAIKAKVGQIADRWNPYLQEELYHGRTAKRVKDFLDFELRPLLTDMQMRGVALPEFEKFLHARHAEERNVQIAKINPKMPDGGSGMTTADAQAYLAGLDPAKRRAYEALAAKVDAITKGTRDGLVADGLEKKEAIDRWTKAYSNYVPLMREEVEETGAGTGMGFSVRGPASRRAMGSDKGVVDILANLAMQRERAIIRAEKNRVATALYGLAVKNPNTEFWKPVNPRLFPAWSAKQKQKLEAELLSMGLDPVDAAGLVREPVQRYVDPRDGLVHERVNPALRGRDNVLSLRVNGEDRFLFFNATDERAARMAHSLKNLDVDQLGRVLSASAVASRWFASVNTQYNPIFGVVNLTRDVQSALFNLSTTPIAGKQAAVLGHTVSALRGIYADIRAHRAGKAPSSTWAQLWEEFQSEGGQTGFRDMWATAGDRTKALESEIRQIGEGKARGAGRAIFAWLSDYNETLENATRLAAYKVALDAGQSKQQAASIAKNLTVNFNRKGQITQQAGALYAFFNASVQGTARLAETLAGPKGRKIIAGGLILGVAQAMLLAAAGFDDDDPPEFVRERNLVIPIGGQQYVTIPMPLGLHVLPSFSRITTEWVLSGFRKPADRLAAIVSMLAETFNPIGNAGLSLQTITPTVVDPLAALAENKDFTGRPIARENINTMQPKPGFERTRDSASWAAKQLAYWLNAASGGTDFTPGLLSPTPDQIDYLVGQVTGGVGRELLKAQQTAGGLASGEEIAPYKMPLVGRFYGDASSGASESARFFDNLKTVYQAKAEMDGRRRAGESVAAYMREHPESRLVTAASQVDRDLDEMKKERREAARRGATAEQLRRMDDRMKARMAAFNRRVEALQQ